VRYAAALSIGLLAACAAVVNLPNPTSPRFEGRYAPRPTPAAATDSLLRIVTFNIKYGRQVERAIEVLRGDSLRGADILALQEVNETAVERIARTLGYDYAYYPAFIHPASGYFGPALLSRWPIERSWKVILPGRGRTKRQQRTATAAVLRVRHTRILAYAVHLEAPISISYVGLRAQAGALLADAVGWPGPVVMAGDFNSEGTGALMEREGYRWLTRWAGPTISWFSWDHIVVRGLAPARPRSVGVVRDVRGASDHHPVWAVAVVRDRPSSGR
jgi:endonuclease/exonuclease/phosphatase family metal-dependent hydrolase